MENDAMSLRGALEQIRDNPAQLIETGVEADPYLKIAGIYKKVGAGGTIMRPTRRDGPAILFNNIKGYPGARVVIGMMGSRSRVGLLLNTPPDLLAHSMNECVENPIPPVFVAADKALCQQVVHMADEPGFDVKKILPVIQTCSADPGPSITMGLCRAVDPETGETDVTMHRIFAQDIKDEITFFCGSKLRHVGMMIAKAESKNEPLPVTISIGLDPAIYMSASFTPPVTHFGFDELSIGGALRGAPVELAKCLTIDGAGIANAEYVIEGEILPGIRVKEDKLTGSGKGLAEFAGYSGDANPAFVIKIKAITHRTDPIYQVCIAPSEELVNMMGIPLEASILNLTGKALPGVVRNVYTHPSGGGRFMVIIQVRKDLPQREGMQRQAALLAFSANPEIKHVILVDEDVDIYDSLDVLWALNTRYQGNIDTVFIPGIYGHPADPSGWPYFSPFSREQGNTCKTIFDCTVPFRLKEEFIRPEFEDVDVSEYFPGLV